MIKMEFSSIDELNPMEIFNSHYIPPKYYKIDSVESYIECVMRLSNSYYELAFRGEPSIYPHTVASVFRSRNNLYIPDMLKKDYYHEIGHSLISLERENFLSFSQHHGLPTELLDITKIPLYALYFACSENAESNTGIVHIYNVEQALDLSMLKIDTSLEYQIFNINKYIENYYRHDSIDEDNFFEIFTQFLHGNSTCTKRLLGDVCLYLDELKEYITDRVREQLTPREIQILNLVPTVKDKYEKLDCLYSLGIEVAHSMRELNKNTPLPEKKYIDYCDFSKFSFNASLIQSYLELLGMSFDIFDLIIGAIENDELYRNVVKVDQFIKKIFLPPLPLIRYRPTVKFDRIKSQEGEFIYQLYKIYKAQLFMDGEELKKNTRINLLIQKISSNTRLVITNKQKILKQLDYLGVNRKLIYPDADNIAKYIKDKYI